MASSTYSFLKTGTLFQSLVNFEVQELHKMICMGQIFSIKSHNNKLLRSIKISLIQTCLVKLRRTFLLANEYCINNKVPYILH